METGLFVFFLSILFLFSVIIGAALFGLSGQSAHLAYVNGQVAEQNMLFHLVKIYAMKSVEVLILATMAFMISAVFRSSSLAIGIGMTISFSLIMLFIYFLVFQLFAFTVFAKRDVAG